MDEIKVLKEKLTIRDSSLCNIIKEIEIPSGQIIQYWSEKRPNTSHEW